jgi:hypothetical protein
MLTEEELQVIRDRPKDYRLFHNVLLAQSDRTRLLEHIDHLNEQLEEAEREKARIRRSLSDG